MILAKRFTTSSIFGRFEGSSKVISFASDRMNSKLTLGWIINFDVNVVFNLSKQEATHLNKPGFDHISEIINISWEWIAWDIIFIALVFRYSFVTTSYRIFYMRSVICVPTRKTEVNEIITRWPFCS